MLRGHEKCRVRPPWVDVEGVESGARLRDFGVDGNRWYVVHGGGVGSCRVLFCGCLWLFGWVRLFGWVGTHILSLLSAHFFSSVL